MSSAELTAELALQEAAWQRNRVLRSLYLSWFAQIAEALAQIEGPTIELGSGIGALRQVLPYVTLTDVEPTRWSEQVVDAEALPFADSSVANLILLDVLHHIPRPHRFFDEARRCLLRGGRVILLEPYCSTVSYRVYRRWHHETTDLRVDPFSDALRSTTAPLDSNQALPTLLFFRRLDGFEERWPELRVVSRRRLAPLAYPLSGGWRRRPLLPQRLLGTALTLERLMAPLESLLAFRCLVILERTASPVT